MRELKFRLWDGNNKHFIYPDDLELDRGLEYQQFTGLMDKNGLPIYEGDILKTKRAWTYGHDEQIDEVEWMIGYKSTGFWPFFEFNAKSVYEVEVIGNVYENPGLLELEVI